MSYFRHATTDDVNLFLSVREPSTGAGVTGASPEVAIRRVRSSQGGGALDGFYYDGAGGFTNIPTWLTMAEMDAVNDPGLYTYLFEQTLIAANIVYLVYFRNTTAPVGFDVEEHLITDEITIPASSPAVPVLPGDTVMGRLVAMENSSGNVAQANADAVLDEIIGPHALISGSVAEAIQRGANCAGGSGSNVVTITVETTLSVPISGAQVDVYLSGNFLFRAHTDVNGQVVLALDDGSYTVNLFASGYSFTVPAALIVSGTTSVTYQGTGLVSVSPPSAPNLCVVYGTLRDVSGKAHDAVCVEVYGYAPQAVSGVQITNRITSTWTDANGYFELELERGARILIKAVDANLDEAIKDVPDSPSQDLSTWADADV